MLWVNVGLIFAICFEPSICIEALLGFIPTIIVFFILKFLKNSLKSKIISLVLTVFLFCSLLFYGFYTIVFAMFSSMTKDMCFSSTEIQKHPYNMQKLTSYESEHGIAHFPITLPQDAANYYFYYCTDFHGEGVQYLKFSANKEYINQIIKQNSVIKKIPYTKINQYYKYLDKFNIEDEKRYTAYILNDNGTVSGIIASNEDIIFFYSNFNLGKM